jgi:hypothetical protein
MGLVLAQASRLAVKRNAKNRFYGWFIVAKSQDRVSPKYGIIL